MTFLQEVKIRKKKQFGDGIRHRIAARLDTIFIHWDWILSAKNAPNEVFATEISVPFTSLRGIQWAFLWRQWISNVTLFALFRFSKLNVMFQFVWFRCIQTYRYIMFYELSIRVAIDGP